MFTPRPYQPPAARYLAARQRGMVQAPAGCGKTIVVSMALDMALSETPMNLRVGWIANTTEQVAQAQAALALFPRIQEQAEVTVACAASQRDWSEMDLLIVDECHHCGSAVGWQTQVDTCRGAIWGMTATPPDLNDERYYHFCRIFGEYNEWHIITREQVGQNLAHAKVVMLDASDPNLAELIDRETEKAMRYRRRWHRGTEQELWGQCCWQAIVEHGIVGNHARNREAVDTALRHADNQVLMLVNQVEYAQIIAANIPKSVACFSKMGKKKRQAALDAFKAGEVKCLVATSLADEGLDLPNADTLILVSGGRSKRLAEQRSGRVLRAFAGKEHGLIYDWQDNFHPLAAKQSRARQEVYRELGYEFV
jgi:superfamily II DNA or RNA helicase